MEIAILHLALIAKYFTTDKHFTYYLLSSKGWHFRRAKINPWGRCPTIDIVLGLEGLVLGLECLVLVLEGQVLVNITGYCIKTAECIVMIFSPHNSPFILVFTADARSVGNSQLSCWDGWPVALRVLSIPSYVASA